MTDHGLIFDDLRRITREGLHGPVPATLAEALPNGRFWVKEDGRSFEFEFSKLVAIGQVVAVTKGPAFAHEADDELRRVDFDDAAAAERTIDVHVRVEELFGPNGRTEPPADQRLFFRWGGLGQLDGRARSDYIAAMRSLGRIVVILDTRPDRDGVLYFPILRGALLGEVNENDELRFPGLGQRERSFTGGIETLEALRQVAGRTL